MVDGLTPMMQQYLETKQECPGAILMFRLGDFYEMFFEDAEIVARELELVLTGREGGKAGRVPMCGVPYHALETYVPRLIERGHKVAICEQVEDPKQAKGLVRREIVRVITPGTFVENRHLTEKQPNYLVAICTGKTGFGLAATDLSTGEFLACELQGTSGLRTLLEEIARLEPKEVLLEPGLEAAPGLMEPLKQLGMALTPYETRAFGHKDAHSRLTQHFAVASLRGFGCEELQLATAAAGATLKYLQDTQKKSLGHITGLRIYEPGAFVAIDSSTRRNLELTRALRDAGKRGTLLWVLDQSVTAMGGRLLRNWLERPLLDRYRVEQRHGAVAEFLDRTLLRADLRSLLKDVYDLERLAGRIALGTADAKDLVNLKLSLVMLPSIRILLDESTAPLLHELKERLDMLDDLRDLIEAAIHDDPPAAITEGGIIKTGYNPEVDVLRSAGAEGKAWIAALEAREREASGIKSLKVGFNKVFGYYLEVTKSNLAQVPAYFIRKQTLAGGERYITPELKELEEKVLGAEEKGVALEYDHFVQVRQRVAEQVVRIQQSAQSLAQLDCLAAFAEVAATNGYVRPQMEESTVLELKDARHPVLDRTLPPGTFVPNDVQIDSGENRLLIITGPNMGGKSTYMRQVALVVLMAQAGAFVPAAAARIGMVDRIFTRVGASDDLATGQSTFMVEMSEVAAILHGATHRSLVVLDEVGRGTATFDGLSIAWAVAEYLLDPLRAGCKTLFATHYHELCELEGMLPGARNYSLAVSEKGEEITFLHKIVRGGADRSYGIQVAKLAGLPRDVIERSRDILSTLEQREGERKGRREIAARQQRQAAQLTFLEQKPHPVVEELLGVNLLALTPLDALNVLDRLQKQAREKA